MTWHCRSCSARLDPASVLIRGQLLVCSGCGVDCRCPPEGEIAVDPVEDFDEMRGQLHYEFVEASVRGQLAGVPWKDGRTIGDQLDRRCHSIRSGVRCSREREHNGAHGAGETQWGGA